MGCIPNGPIALNNELLSRVPCQYSDLKILYLCSAAQ